MICREKLEIFLYISFKKLAVTPLGWGGEL
jgi:hypothetical protein